MSKEESEETGAKAPFQKYVLPVINTTSILVGIVLGLVHLREISKNAEDISKGFKISTIPYLDEFADQFEATQVNRARFISELAAKEEEVRQRIGAGETGQTIYHSEPMADYHDVCGFWERSAAFVELGYFDFTIVYALKSFPRNFWNDSAEVRNLLRKNWYGKDKPLPDFLSGMEELGKMYREEDAKTLGKAGKGD